ncbi:MAG TPA: hypothetical protein VNM68_07910 [Candidatus Polarisedimenticolia bacterium]|jgi:ElaB/YqjD/DUF883 family membrane-anchored ribosome-binding protein|nr:hypothetical protein [Candidatus Polarisedimenticolia bacterium]
MRQSVLERTGDYIAESAERASRATSAVVDAVDDGVGMVKRATKHGRHAAEDILDDATRRIQRHPVKATVATFAVALGVGVVIGSLLRRR